jgi:hypothetical protein
MRHVWSWLVVTCTAAGAGCDAGGLALGPARDDSPVQTDAVIYTLKRGPGAWYASALATYRNVDTVPVSFYRCLPTDTLPIFTVRRTGTDTTRPLFAGWAWACVGGVSAGSLAPGASITVQVPLGSVDQPHMQPPFQRDWMVGRMRVELQLCRLAAADSGTCEPMSQAERQSNAFDVRF